MRYQRIDQNTRTALESAWHQDSAAASLERWLELRKQEHWGPIPQNLPLLVRVFGASWYFTRFVFYRGPAIVPWFDQENDQALSEVKIRARIRDIDTGPSPDQALEKLRIVKNEVMLCILLDELRGFLDQAALEQRLTVLAEETLACALRIYSREMAPELENRLAVFGMGRMAGEEMNFGSDLDLIFLYPGSSQAVLDRASRLIRALLRGIAMTSPAGMLYDVDMRLRPHGAAGVLITSEQSFREYHFADREVWQRQLMTRCRPVIDSDGLASRLWTEVSPCIYAQYDKGNLRREIRSMRLRVEHELGLPAGRYELKRGKGGIMDVDFISHYLQLAHGHAVPELQVASTRTALQKLSEHDCLATAQREALLQGYNFLKQLEGRLRVFDMKPVSSMGQDPEQLTALARAMGYFRDSDKATGEALRDRYLEVTDCLRRMYDEVVSDE